MKFEFYVLNFNFNEKKIEMFNIFQNVNIQEWVEKSVRKYLRSPKSFKYEDKTGFDALCEDIRRTIAWQERGRREYEISVGDAFETNCDRLEKWDCYKQAEPNIEIITRECIYQYKQQRKEENEKTYFTQ